MHGRSDQVIRELKQANTGTLPAAGHLLLCRAFLSELRGAEAAGECRAALAAGLSNDAVAQDWAGRAFGAQAEHAGPLAGLHLAGQVRSAFQTAHTLDPHSAPAANDLGEFFIAAPSIVGGGLPKAAALADQIEPALPEIAHRLRALLAEKRGDITTAEREFIAETEVAQNPGAYVDLATFYGRHQQEEKSIAAARRAITLDRAEDADIVDAASALGDAHQIADAVKTFHAYLEHGRQSDRVPIFRVHTMLGQLLLAQGDRDAARAEFQAALALAASYAPARKGLAAL